MSTTLSKEQQQQRFETEIKKIVKQIKKELNDLLMSTNDSDCSYDVYDDNIFTITLEHPDLMDDRQARADVSDMISLCEKSPLVKEVDVVSHSKPSFADLYKGLFLPSVTLSIKMF